MGCEHIEELLSLFLEGELAHEERQSVESHIRDCPTCEELLSLLRETKESLSSFPELDVSESLTEKLYDVPVKKKRFGFVFDFLLKPSVQPIMAAVAVVCVLVSFYAFHPERAAINREIDRQFHIGISKVTKLYAEAESLTQSLGEYKDNFLVSLKNLNPFRGNEAEQPKT